MLIFQPIFKIESSAVSSGITLIDKKKIFLWLPWQQRRSTLVHGCSSVNKATNLDQNITIKRVVLRNRSIKKQIFSHHAVERINTFPTICHLPVYLKR